MITRDYRDLAIRMYLSLGLRLADFHINDLNAIQRAFWFALKAHDGQLRKSGAPAIVHPLGTVRNLLECVSEIPGYVIVAALLHDVIEDTDTQHSMILDVFGPKIHTMILALTKLEGASDGEFFAQVVRAARSEPMILAVRLADRLDNLRSLRELSPESQSRIFIETREVFISAGTLYGFDDLVSSLEHELSVLETTLNLP